MVTKFGLYKNKIFMLDINNNKIELTSNNMVNRNIGFQEYVDVLVNSHSDILIKI